MMNNTAIHHIYVIGNKAREPDRIQYLEDYFSASPLDIPVSYYQPTYKDTLTIEETQRFFKSMPHHHRPFKLSEMSVFLNFYYLFQHIIRKFQDGYILILESDVRFEGDLAEYLQSLTFFLETQRPDGCSLGSGCDLIDDAVDTEDMTLQIAKKPVMRCMDTLLFSVAGIRKLLWYMDRFGRFDEPIDNFIETYLKGQGKDEFSFYWIWPSITLQGSQYGHYKTSIQDDTS
jgi:hypothetical protein